MNPPSTHIVLSSSQNQWLSRTFLGGLADYFFGQRAAKPHFCGRLTGLAQIAAGDRLNRRLGDLLRPDFYTALDYAVVD